MRKILLPYRGQKIGKCQAANQFFSSKSGVRLCFGGSHEDSAGNLIVLPRAGKAVFGEAATESIENLPHLYRGAISGKSHKKIKDSWASGLPQ
jgi:hypothetical protein